MGLAAAPCVSPEVEVVVEVEMVAGEGGGMWQAGLSCDCELAVDNNVISFSGFEARSASLATVPPEPGFVGLICRASGLRARFKYYKFPTASCLVALLILVWPPSGWLAGKIHGCSLDSCTQSLCLCFPQGCKTNSTAHNLYH